MRNFVLSIVFSLSFLTIFNASVYANEPQCSCGGNQEWVNFTAPAKDFFTFSATGNFIHASGEDLTSFISMGEQRFAQFDYYKLNDHLNPNTKMLVEFDPEGFFKFWICVNKGTGLKRGLAEYVQYEEALSEEEESPSHQLFKKSESLKENPEVKITNRNSNRIVNVSSIIGLDKDGTNGNVVIGTIDFCDIVD